MYKVYLDDKLMYHPNVVERFPLMRAIAELEVNKAGTFTFAVHKNNPRFNEIEKLKSIVKIYDDNYRLFRGRVLNIKRGFYNELEVTCEGELAFFVDSIVRPYTFSGTVKEYFAFLVNQHNDQMQDAKKRFLVGDCTVEDGNDYIVRENINCPRTLDEMKEKLIDLLGGYFWFRETEEGVYIDYLKDFELMNTQRIVFGENLLNLEEVIKGQDIATAIIPRGAKLQDEDGNELDERLTIEEVNGGVDYVYSPDAVEKYGWIYKVVEWDDVTLPSNLIEKAYKELQNSIHPSQTIELSAVDLHALNLQIQSFRLGRYTFVESKPHEFYDYFLTRKVRINILKPSDGNLILGDERKTFIDKQHDTKLHTSQLQGMFGNLKNQYLHIRYSQNPDGTGMTEESTENTLYIGTCTTTSKEAPTNPASYSWTLVKGKDGADAVTLRIDSSRGTVFKNNEVSTVLSVVIYHGSQRITDASTLKKVLGSSARLEWLWQRVGEDTFGTILSTDTRIGNNGFTFTLTPDDVDVKVVFMCQLITD